MKDEGIKDVVERQHLASYPVLERSESAAKIKRARWTASCPRAMDSVMPDEVRWRSGKLGRGRNRGMMMMMLLLLVMMIMMIMMKTITRMADDTLQESRVTPDERRATTTTT